MSASVTVGVFMCTVAANSSLAVRPAVIGSTTESTCTPAPRSAPSTAWRSISSAAAMSTRSEEHTSELQSPCNLVCRLLLEKKKKIHARTDYSVLNCRSMLDCGDTGLVYVFNSYLRRVTASHYADTTSVVCGSIQHDLMIDF